MKTLRKRGFTLPIVALTANAVEADRQRCHEYFDLFLTKPIGQAELIPVLRDLIDRGMLPTGAPRRTDWSSKPPSETAVPAAPV